VANPGTEHNVSAQHWHQRHCEVGRTQLDQDARRRGWETPHPLGSGQIVGGIHNGPRRQHSATATAQLYT